MGTLSDKSASGSVTGPGAVTFPKYGQCNGINTAGLRVTTSIRTHAIKMHRKEVLWT